MPAVAPRVTSRACGFMAAQAMQPPLSLGIAPRRNVGSLGMLPQRLCNERVIATGADRSKQHIRCRVPAGWWGGESSTTTSSSGASRLLQEDAELVSSCHV